MQSNQNNNGQSEKQPQKAEKGPAQEELVDAERVEEYSQRIVQLQQTEKEKEADHESPFHRQHMKIHLANEIWFGIFPLVPRSQLGQIVPQIGRQFGGIVQFFLHDEVDNKVTLGNISIYPPRDSDAYDLLRLQVRPKYAQWDDAQWDDEPWCTISQQLVLPHAPMPANIKDFLYLLIWYLDTSILNFLRTFHQNSLFWNVNLELDIKIIEQMWNANLELVPEQMDGLLTTLSYVLPLIDSINSIQGEDIDSIANLYHANSEMALDMLKMTRILGILVEDYQFKPTEADSYNRWLYMPRDDGKPRVLILPPDSIIWYPSSKVMQFIKGSIILEFAKAKFPCSFFIRLWVLDTVEWQDISIENGETKEKLVVKKISSHNVAQEPCQLGQQMVLISRYPLNADRKWIEANEKEALEWNFAEQSRRIRLYNYIKNAIPWSAEHNSHQSREAHYRNIRQKELPNADNEHDKQGGNSEANQEAVDESLTAVGNEH